MPHVAQADEIVLHGGEAISGQFVSLNMNTVVWKTNFAGRIKIRRDKVIGLTVARPVTVMMRNRTRFTGLIGWTKSGVLQLTGPGGPPLPLPLTKIAGIYHPGAEALRAYHISGHLNAGLNVTSGSGTGRSYNFNGDMLVLHRKDRFTADATFNQQTINGTQTQNSASLILDYNHFINHKWYLTVNGTGERNIPLGLRARLAAGAGLGYEIFNTTEHELRLEFGPDYVRDYFTNSPNDSYPAARWAVIFHQQLFVPWLRFFHHDSGFAGLTAPNNVSAQARTGIRIKLGHNWQGTAETDQNWLNHPPVGKKHLDLVYLVTVGYAW